VSFELSLFVVAFFFMLVSPHSNGFYLVFKERIVVVVYIIKKEVERINPASILKY
jgi:hypothetical protein